MSDRVAREIQAFRDAVIARNVVARVTDARAKRAQDMLRAAAEEGMGVEAFDFPSLDSLKKYLHKHPNADKSKHHVEKPDSGAAAGGAKKFHDSHGNSGTESSVHAAQIQGKTHELMDAVKGGDKHAVGKAVEDVQDSCAKLTNKAESVLKDIDAFLGEHKGNVGESSIHDHANGLHRALNEAKGSMKAFSDAAGKGLSATDAKTVKDVASSSADLAAVVSNAVKEMKRLSAPN